MADALPLSRAGAAGCRSLRAATPRRRPLPQARASPSALHAHASALPLPSLLAELQRRRGRGAGVAACASPVDDAGGVLAFLKGVQAGLPVIGLVSRLTAPGGGLEGTKLGYQEYARNLYERDTDGSRACGFAIAELSRARKLVRAPRALLRVARARARALLAGGPFVTHASPARAR
jgi:hypothetical protein